ncbi:unnamed protein product [Phyllotreta striolata]|uniref:Uncharacterized protein n=1 Tax=Phyllotreta striolata TaxID=444603 RepID=A0A9N9XQF2_PHYSR|nr:unnamed protein product [Phyllotreta striolata]
MFTTLDPKVPVMPNKNHNSVYIYSTFVPVCVCFVLIVAVWRVRRRIRTKKILVTSVFVVTSDNQRNLPQSAQEGALNVIANKKPKNQNRKKIKIITKNQKNFSISTISFPREPMYKSQGKPAYLVPFTALPPNFDYSLKNVEVHSDFVVIKDLEILQTYWYEKEEYKKPAPYNTNIS